MYILIIQVLLFCLKAAALNYIYIYAWRSSHTTTKVFECLEKRFFETISGGGGRSSSSSGRSARSTHSPRSRNKAPQPKTTAHGSWFHLLNFGGFWSFTYSSPLPKLGPAQWLQRCRGSTPLCRSPSVCLRVAKPMQLLGWLMVRFSSPMIKR